jgi:hypothetical protein
MSGITESVRNSDKPPRSGFVQHDTYTTRLVTPEELKLHNHIFSSLRRDFGLKLEVDRMLAAHVAFFCVKLYAAIEANAPDLMAHYDRLVRQNLECLKATRDKRDGAELKVTTPAEWAADLVANYRKRQAAQEGTTNETASGSDRPAHGGNGAPDRPPRRDE